MIIRQPGHVFFSLNGNVGIGTTNPGYTLTVNGDSYVTSGSWTASDARLKKNVTPLTGSLNKIAQLNGVNYFWRNGEYPEMKFTSTKQVGFIAQDIEGIIPEIVTTNKDGFKGVSYEKLTPILVEAIKELKAEVERLKTFLE